METKKITNRIKRIATLLRLDEDYSKKTAAADLNELEEDLVKLFAMPVVVGRSEQLFCNCGFSSSTFQLETGEVCCCNCENEIAK